MLPLLLLPPSEPPHVVDSILVAKVEGSISIASCHLLTYVDHLSQARAGSDSLEFVGLTRHDGYEENGEVLRTSPFSGVEILLCFPLGRFTVG